MSRNGRVRTGVSSLLLSMLVGLTEATQVAAGTEGLKGKFVEVKQPSTHEPGKVKMTEFVDFYCPHCHMFEQSVLPLLMKEFGHKLEVTMVGFPVVSGKLPMAFEMYEQAKAMGKGNDMKRVLFQTIHRSQIHVLDKTIRESLIKEVGLDPVVFEAGLDSGKPRKAVEEGKAWGVRVQVQHTPTILLDGNIKADGISPDNLKALIAGILESDRTPAAPPKAEGAKQ